MKTKLLIISVAIITVIIYTNVKEVNKKINQKYQSVFSEALAYEEIEEPRERTIKEDRETQTKEIEEEVKQDDWILAEFSAYNNVEEQCDSTPNETANGHIIKGDEKIVAVNGYNFGTKIEIEGMGEYVVMDRMNKRYGINNIDILFHKNIKGALKFGRKQLRYRIIN